MNLNKEGSGWILCPSKSYPGKFYYFNVRNGAALWGSNDINNKSTRKGTGHEIADKLHCYPEPSSPPLDEYSSASNSVLNNATFTPQNTFNIVPEKMPNSSNANNSSNTSTLQNMAAFTTQKLFNISLPNKMSNNSYINNGANMPTRQSTFHTQKPYINVRRTILNQQQPFKTENSYHNFIQPNPQYNQVMFPNYVSNVDPYMQNIIWAPLQVPRPMFMPNTVVKTEVFDENTPSWENRDPIVVQSCNIPLTQRFVNFEENLQTVNEQSETLTSRQMFGPTNANIRNSNERYIPMFESIGTSNFHPIEKLRTQSESVRTVIANNLKEKSENANFQIQYPFTSLKKQSEPDKVVISYNAEEKSNNTTNLQIKNISPFTTPLFEKNEALKVVNAPTIVKYPNLKNNGVLEKNTLKPTLFTNYRVENENVDSLQNLVKSDLRFLLMSKRRRIHDLEGISSDVERKTIKTSAPRSSFAECVPKKRVRFLINEQSDTSSEEIQQESMEDILIRDNNKLRTKANLNNDTSQDVQDGVNTTEMFEREHPKNMNIQITLKNETNSNLFLQSIDEIKPFSFSKGKTLVNTFKIPLFKDMKAANKQTNTRNVVISPIFENKSVNYENNLSFYHDSDTNEIGVGMQNLFIKENCLAKNSKYQLQKIIFDPVGDVKNKNVIKSQWLIKSTENDNNYSNVSTMQNESEHEDAVISFVNENINRKTTEEKFKGKKIILNRKLRSKLGKSDANNKEKSNDTNLFKDTDVSNNKERLQVTKTLLNRVSSSKIDKLDANIHREVNICTESNISVHNIVQSDPMSLKRVDIDKKLDNLKNRLIKNVERPQINDLNDTNTLDGKLKKFQLKNELMSETINLKIEALLCTYTQIMEETLSSLLQKSNAITSSLTPPWTLHEALTCIKKVYDNNEVRMYADELTLLILNNSCKRGKLQRNLKPKDFMRTFGLGSLLIDHLKILEPQCNDLSEAQQSLNIMWENISSPKIDDNIELTLPVPTRSDEELTPTVRKYFVKKTEDIFEWLDKNKGVVDNSKLMNARQNDTKIVRTFGKNINLLTINNTKSLTMNKRIGNEGVKTQTGTKENARPKAITQVEHIIKNNDGTIKEADNVKTKSAKPVLLKNSEPKIIRSFYTSTPNTENLKENNLNIPTHGNTFHEDNNDGTDGPKVIRNLKLIDAYEKKLTSNNDDCAKIDETFSTLTVNISSFTISDDVTDNKSQDMSIELNGNNTFHEFSSNSKQKDNDTFTQNNDTLAQNNDTFAQNDDTFPHNGDTFSQNNDKSYYNDETVNKSVQMSAENVNCAKNDLENNKNKENLDVDNTNSLESDNAQMYTVLRFFLSKLSLSMKMIYKFIDECILKFRNTKAKGDKLKSLRHKATMAHEYIICVVYKLKCIIQRESGPNTILKGLLKYNADAAADVRMTRYRQVITKLLEQAQILENALKIVISIADGDLDTPLYSYEHSPVYFNIFE